MSSQLLDLALFHLLCTSHDILDQQVGNCHKPGDLVDQVDCSTRIWSHGEDGPDCLCLMMPEFFFGSISCFHIAGTLRSSDLNRSSNREWYADV